MQSNAEIVIEQNILLIGVTGAGKSTLANILTNQKGAFKESSNMESCTKQC